MIRATMKTRKRLCYAATLLALFCLSSCGQNDSDNTLLPAGKYPMAFTPLVNELAATRATPDNTWDGGETVTLQVGDEMKLYKISGSGSSSTLTSTDPFYWTSSNETKSVCGWYCGNGYSNIPLKSWEVQYDQSDDNYKGSDLLYAPAQDISFADENKSLTFYHQTARVVINIVNAEVATDASQIKYVVFGDNDNLALAGSYTAPDRTKGETFGTWKIDDSSSNTIIPKEITPSDSKYLKSYTALLIPQNMQGKKFIAITLTDEKTYYYTPKEINDANFEAGKEYTYDVTVKYGKLDAVLVSESETWDSNGKPIKADSRLLAPGFSVTDLKTGDYYYSDGTTSDGGYRKYADGTSEVLDIRPVTESAGTSRSVIGIVFWVGDATEKDQTLKREHSNCTHGLVVALNDASDAIAWQEPFIYVQEWLNNNPQVQYLPVASAAYAYPLNNIQGYNNTGAIEVFNDVNSNYIVTPVKKVVEYRSEVLAPANSSDWYLPSAKELTLLSGKDVTDIFKDNNIGAANKDLINKKIALIGNVATEISTASYWSSTEVISGRFAYITHFSKGTVNSHDKDTKNRVRCVLAF